MQCPNLDVLPAPPADKSGWPWTEETHWVTGGLPDGRLWPRVSVITPSYNQGQYIEETIRSVLLQGYPDLEYILIDGGSTDGSVEIIQKYQPWLAYWVSEPDAGQTQAINKGWDWASGKILAYLNSDDYYLPGSIYAAVERFVNDPSLGMVYGTASIIDGLGKEQRLWEALPFDVKTMLVEENIVPQPATFYSSEALECLGYLKEQYQMIMDYELSIRLGMQFPVACLTGRLASFRDHFYSKTRTKSEAAALELIHFGTSFFAQNRSSPELQSIRAATFGRYYYLLALSIVAQGRTQSPRALMPLFQSFRVYPRFVLRRPLQTAYVIKEGLLGYLQNRSIRSAPRSV